MKYHKIFRPSVVPLLIANFTPIFGVMFFNWNLLEIIILYWFESGIIGFYTILKLAKIGNFKDIPFFIVHFGGCMFGLLVVIFAFFSPSPSFPRLDEILSASIRTTAVPLAIFFTSHGFSFIFNFIGNREYTRTDSGTQMFSPYARIFIMQFTALLGGGLVMIFKEPALGLIFIILAKSIADLSSHLKEHSSLQTT